MKLVYASGPNKDKEVELKPPFISLGRESDNDVMLTEEEASRYHAKIEKDGSIWVVRDLNSSNGVRLNGQKIDESAPLEHKDELRLGGSTFMVIDESATSEDKPPASEPATAEGGEKTVGKPSSPKADSPAQKRVRLMLVALIAMILTIVAAYLAPILLKPQKKNQTLSIEELRLQRLKAARLHLEYTHEKSGYDPDLNGLNLSIYTVTIQDGKLTVRVENVNDGVKLAPPPVEISEDEEAQLKMDLLENDDFVKVSGMPPKERDNSYERVSLMIRAGNRGNAVEYINESGLLPAPVLTAIDKIKRVVEDRLDIPRMSKAEAFKRADELFVQAKRNYVEKRVHPLNLYRAIQETNEALVILKGYKERPPFYLELQTLNMTCKQEHQAIIEDMQKKAVVEEQTDPVKALERYRSILTYIDDTNDRDYRAAREKIYILERKLKKERR